MHWCWDWLEQSTTRMCNPVLLVCVAIQPQKLTPTGACELVAAWRITTLLHPGLAVCLMPLPARISSADALTCAPEHPAPVRQQQPRPQGQTGYSTM